MLTILLKVSPAQAADYVWILIVKQTLLWNKQVKGTGNFGRRMSSV
jgi:hypothetical protein